MINFSFLFFSFLFFSFLNSGIDMWDEIWGKVGGEVEGKPEESEKLHQLISDFREFLTEYHPYLDTKTTLERLQVRLPFFYSLIYFIFIIFIYS